MGNNFPVPYKQKYQASNGSVIKAKCCTTKQFKSCTFTLSSAAECDDRNANLALVVNPILNGNGVIVKSRLYGRWGQEKMTRTNPFKPSFEFTFHLKRTLLAFEITISDLYFITFPCNEATEEVNYFFIEGDVTIEDVQFFRLEIEETDALEAGYKKPLPPSPSTKQALAMRCEIETLPPPYTLIDGKDKPKQTIQNPALPSKTPIKGIMRIGALFRIQGTPNNNATRFSVGLSCGSHQTAEQSLHIEAQFDNEEGKNIVVRAFKRGGSLDKLQTHQPYFPFHLGVPFVMTIAVKEHEFEIRVNHQPFTLFTHQIYPIERADHLIILGDLEVAQVDLY